MTRLHRRNFFPAFIFNCIFFIAMTIIVLFTQPDKKLTIKISSTPLVLPINIVLFFLSSFLFLAFTLSLLLANTRRGFLISLLINSILFLRLVKLAHWWNIVILIAIFIFVELYFSSGNKPKNDF